MNDQTNKEKSAYGIRKELGTGIHHKAHRWALPLILNVWGGLTGFSLDPSIQVSGYSIGQYYSAILPRKRNPDSLQSPSAVPGI